MLSASVLDHSSFHSPACLQQQCNRLPLGTLRQHRLTSCHCRINTRTREVTREVLFDEQNADHPKVNPHFYSRPTRFCYFNCGHHTQGRRSMPPQVRLLRCCLQELTSGWLHECEQLISLALACGAVIRCAWRAPRRHCSRLELGKRASHAAIAAHAAHCAVADTVAACRPLPGWTRTQGRCRRGTQDPVPSARSLSSCRVRMGTLSRMTATCWAWSSTLQSTAAASWCALTSVLVL